MKFIPYKIMAVIFLIAIINPIYAQEISGRIFDVEDSPISNVSIILNYEVIAKTNSEGLFTLTESYKLPLKLKLEHPDYYIKSVTLSQYKTVLKLTTLDTTEYLEKVIISSTYQKES